MPATSKKKHFLLFDLTITTIFLCMFCSCSFWGSRTIYVSDSKSELGPIVFTKLIQDKGLAELFPINDSIYQATIQLISREYGIEQPIYAEKDWVDFEEPNENDVQKIISETNRQYLLLTRMSLIAVLVNSEIAYFDADVEMKLLDQNGKTTLITAHNTALGNSYISFPTRNRVIHDGIDGAFRKVLKEFGHKKMYKFDEQYVWDSPDTRLYKKGTKSTLAIYRRADRENNKPITLTVNDTAEYSFIPNSFIKLQFEWFNKPIKVCTSEDYCIFIETNPEEVSYLKCALADDQETTVIEMMSTTKGEFESIRPEKEQKKRNKNK